MCTRVKSAQQSQIGQVLLIGTIIYSSNNPSFLSFFVPSARREFIRKHKMLSPIEPYDLPEYFPSILHLGIWLMYKHCKLVKPNVDVTRDFFLRKNAAGDFKLRNVPVHRVANPDIRFASFALPSLYLNLVDISQEDAVERTVSSYIKLEKLKARLAT